MQKFSKPCFNRTIELVEQSHFNKFIWLLKFGGWVHTTSSCNLNHDDGFSGYSWLAAKLQAHRFTPMQGSGANVCLKTVSSRQTSRKLTCVEAVLFGSALSTLSFMLSETMIRLSILISQVEPSANQKPDPPWRYILSFRTLSGATLTSIPHRGTIY